MKGVNDDVMGTGIAKAASSLDNVTPRVAWHFREWADLKRTNKLSDPNYKENT